MARVEELLRTEKDGTISFGDYTLASKTKLDNFEFEGDLYKVKTFAEITKLEKNGYLRKDAPEKEDDGRKVYLSLTDRAREVLKEAEETLLKSTSAVFEQMDDEAKNKFYDKLMELQQIFAIGGIKL